MMCPIGVIISIISLSLVNFSFSYGAQETAWKGTIEQVDGITIINNPKEPIYADNFCVLEEELKIGEAEGLEEYMFQQIGSIAVDEDERIYISDWKESHIKVYNQSGEYLRTIGRRGQGPGEFQRITRIQILKQNELFVFDGNSRRLSFFSLDGRFIKLKSVPAIQALDLMMNSKGELLANAVQLNPQSAQAVTSVGIYDSEFRPVKTLIASEPQDVLMPFLPFNVWTPLKNETILVGFNKFYDLHIFDFQGNLIKRIKKDFAPVKITTEEKRERLKSLQQPLYKEVPNSHPAFRKVTDDDEGRLFVETWEQPESGDGHVFNVHDKEGRFLSTITLKFPPKVWKKGKLYTIETDEEGYQYVKRYKVSWNY